MSTSVSSRVGPPSTTSYLGWSQRPVGDAVVIDLTGELDILTLADFRLRLTGLLESTDTVVLDLSGLEFISVASVRVILYARDSAAVRGRTLCVRGQRGIAARVFDLFGPSAHGVGPAAGPRLDSRAVS